MSYFTHFCEDCQIPFSHEFDSICPFCLMFGKPLEPLPDAPQYCHRDKQGIKWRFVGARPVSELADTVMRECGMKLWGEL